MSYTQALLAGVALALASALATADEQQTIDSVRKTFDEQKLIELQDRLSDRSTSDPVDFDAAYGAAETRRIRADWRLTRRTIGDRDAGASKEMKRLQMEIAESGIPYAERAVERAQTPEQETAANRVLGELYSLLIDGPVSGMRNGPKAKAHIELARETSPDDPEAMRARGLMFLHNPPFTGGDVDKAIEIFSRCGEIDTETEIYDVQLALAYRKAGRLDDARVAAERALDKNPSNENARVLVAMLASDGNEAP